MAQAKVKIYAKALFGAFEKKSEKESEQIARRFKGILKKRGDLKLANQIMRELERLWQEREGKPGKVVAAAPLPENLRQKMKASLATKGYVMQEQIEPAVIGGTAVFLGNDYLIDGTMRGRLRKLYSSIRTKF